MGLRPTDIKATWHPHGLNKLQGILNENILYPTINPDQWNPYIVRIPQSTYKETSSCPRNRSQFYTTIKTLGPKKKGMHNLLQL